MKLHVKSIVLWAVALVAAAGMTACSDSSSETVVPDPELVAINLNGNVSGSLIAEAAPAHASVPESRAVIDYKHTQAVPLSFARLDMDRTTGNYPANGYASVTSALSAELAASSDGSASAITFNPTAYYLIGQTNNSTKLVGWHPAVDGTSVTYAAGVVTVPINGENDIMLSNELEGSKTDKFDTKTLTFSHKLTQIKIDAYAVSDAAKDAWGKIKTITLKNQLPTCKITLPATVTFEGTAADLALARKKASDDSALAAEVELGVATSDGSGNITAKNAAECGYAMIQPIASGTKLSLDIEMADGRKESLTIDDWTTGYLEGNAYTITLKFTISKIELDAQITAWKNFDWATDGDGSFDGEIEL